MIEKEFYCSIQSLHQWKGNNKSKFKAAGKEKIKVWINMSGIKEAVNHLQFSSKIGTACVIFLRILNSKLQDLNLCSQPFHDQ